jgi:hypothetical protein
MDMRVIKEQDDQTLPPDLDSLLRSSLPFPFIVHALIQQRIPKTNRNWDSQLAPYPGATLSQKSPTHTRNKVIWEQLDRNIGVHNAHLPWRYL